MAIGRSGLLRRRRRPFHRVRRAVREGAPLLLVLLAVLLSMGVVRLVEVRQADPAPALGSGRVAESPPPPRVEAPLASIDDVLRTSILDGRIERLAEDEPPAPTLDLSEWRPRVGVDAPPVLVPEPGTFALVLVGLIRLLRERYSTIPRSSTSNVSAAPGGMIGGIPCAL